MKTQSAKQKTRAEIYLELMQKRASETIDLTAPSGAIFTFQKPNELGLAFSDALSGALENNESNPDTGKNAILKIREQILNRSVDPKIVGGKAENNNEISIEDIPNEDLGYLVTNLFSGNQNLISNLIKQ